MHDVWQDWKGRGAFPVLRFFAAKTMGSDLYGARVHIVFFYGIGNYKIDLAKDEKKAKLGEWTNHGHSRP